jgi:hypothetical protein
MTYIPTSSVRKTKLKPTLLKAIFEDGAVLFRLSDTATLGDIAQRLDDVGPLHIGGPLAIDVTFSPIAHSQLAGPKR